MMLLQGFSLILTWSYALIFWLLVGAFLPPRGNWPLKLVGFLLCGWPTRSSIPKNGTASLLQWRDFSCICCFFIAAV